MLYKIILTIIICFLLSNCLKDTSPISSIDQIELTFQSVDPENPNAYLFKATNNINYPVFYHTTSNRSTPWYMQETQTDTGWAICSSNADIYSRNYFSKLNPSESRILTLYKSRYCGTPWRIFMFFCRDCTFAFENTYKIYSANIY